MKALLHRWIILYNPFYFAGSLFLLTGVMLLQHQTVGAAYDWKYIFLGTFAALQSYELCVIALAAWLHRCQGMRRPAVILALLECLFLIDPTLSGQLVAHLAHVPQFDLENGNFRPENCRKLLILGRTIPENRL